MRKLEVAQLKNRLTAAKETAGMDDGYIVLMQNGKITPEIKAMCKTQGCSEQDCKDAYADILDEVGKKDMPVYTATGPDLSDKEAKTAKKAGKQTVGFIADRTYVEKIDTFKTASGLLVVNVDDIT